MTASTLYSACLGATCRFDIYVPNGNATPAEAQADVDTIVYLLDGHFLGELVNGELQFMNRMQQAPSAALVSIHSPNRLSCFTPTHSLLDPDGQQESTFAGSGKAPVYLRFLVEELIPHIEKTDCAQVSGSQAGKKPITRVLAGYSISGLFALYAGVCQPTTFDGIVAVDPSLWWDNAFLLHHTRQRLAPGAEDKRPAFPPTYLCAGHTPENRSSNMPENAQAYTHLLRDKGYSVHYDDFVDETHSTISVRGFYQGLKWVFGQAKERNNAYH